MYTVDASVFLNAYDTTEVGYEQSRRLLDLLRMQGTPLVEPTLILVEVAATISRTRGAVEQAHAFAAALARLPNLRLAPLDADRAEQAAAIAATYRLRGADAVYVAVARQAGCQLITLDREQHDRAAASIATRYPAELLAEFEASRAEEERTDGM